MEALHHVLHHRWILRNGLITLQSSPYREIIINQDQNQNKARIRFMIFRFHVVEIYHGVLVTVMAADLNEDNSR